MGAAHGNQIAKSVQTLKLGLIFGQAGFCLAQLAIDFIQPLFRIR